MNAAVLLFIAKAHNKNKPNKGGISMTDKHPSTIKHIICIQDISCYGKCSLTVALPILNAAGLHVSPLPTALLSTHTGGFGNPHKLDLHNEMKGILNHWENIAISADAIYSGYAANKQQLDLVKQAFQQYPDALHLVDPVMGDHGKRYASLSNDVELGMKELCHNADIITPNMTEAYILLDEPFQTEPYSETELFRITTALKQRYQADIILTGASTSQHQLGCVCLSDNEKPKLLMAERLPYHYHGSGDLFTSAFLGAYLNNQSLIQACQTAMTYTIQCMKYSHETSQPERNGICFEPFLVDYIALCQSEKNI